MTTPHMRMETLERATLRLSDQVAGLNSALLAVNELGQQQSALHRAQEELAEQIVPRDEVERRAREIEDTLRDYRKRFYARLMGGVVLAMALVGVLSVLALNYAHASRQRSVRVCQHENAERLQMRDYLLAVRANSTNPELVKAAQKATSNYQPIDCGTL